MVKFNQKGFAHILLILILLVGIIAGVYLVQHPILFKSKAFENGEVNFMDNGKRAFPNNTTDNIFVYLEIKPPSWEAQSGSYQYTTSLRVSLDKNKLEPESECSFIEDEDYQNIIQRANKSKDFLGLLAEKLYKNGYAPLESLSEYFPDIIPKDLGGIYPDSSQQNLKVKIDQSTLSRNIREIEAGTGYPEANCQEVTLDKPTDTIYLSWVLPKKDGDNTIYVRFFSNKGNTKDVSGSVIYKDDSEISAAVPTILVGGQALATTLVEALRKIPGTAAFNAAAVFITRVQTAGEQIITLSQAKQLGFNFNFQPNKDGTIDFNYDQEQLSKLDISLEFFPDPDPLTGEPRLQVNPKANLTDQEDVLQGSLDIVAGEIGGRVIGNLINRGVTRAVETQAFKTVKSKVKIDLTDFKNTVEQNVFSSSDESALRETILSKLARQGKDTTMINAADNLKPLISAYKNSLEKLIKTQTEEQFAISHNELLVIAVDGNLAGKSIDFSVPDRYHYHYTDFLQRRAELIRIYAENRELAKLIVNNEILGFHGSKSGTLFSVLDEGLIPLSVLRQRGELVPAGERVRAMSQNIQETTSAFRWFQSRGISRYSRNGDVMTVDELINGIKILRDPNIIDPSMSMEMRQAAANDTEKVLEFLQQVPTDTEMALKQQLIQSNFPVAYAFNGKGIETSDKVSSHIYGEFIVPGGVPRGNIKALFVPEDKIDFVKTNLNISDLPIFPLEILNR